MCNKDRRRLQMESLCATLRRSDMCWRISLPTLALIIAFAPTLHLSTTHAATDVAVRNSKCPPLCHTTIETKYPSSEKSKQSPIHAKINSTSGTPSVLSSTSPTFAPIALPSWLLVPSLHPSTLPSNSPSTVPTSTPSKPPVDMQQAVQPL